MKEKKQEKPVQKPEMLQQKKNYCWLTGYPNNNGGNETKKPIYQPLRLKV
jgi:hypothetical protein